MRRLATFVPLMLVASVAIAAYCCDPWGAPTRQIFIQVGQSVAKVIDSSTQDLSQSLEAIDLDWQQGAGQQAAELTRQTAQQREMTQGLMATQQADDAQSVVATAAEQSKPAAQQDTTVTDAALAEEMEPILDDKVRAYDLAWSNAFLSTKALDVGHSVMARHQPYCSPQDVAAKICTQAAIPALQNADLTINSIYQPGEGQYDTLSDQEHAAAMAFVQNLTQPTPYQPPTNKMTGVASELSAQLASDQAVEALVAHSFDAQIAERTRRHE